MAEGSAPAGSLSGIAEGARVLGMSARSLWIGYYGLGGNGSADDVDGWLSGDVAVPDRDYDLMVQVLNDEFIGQGLDHPVPYRAGGLRLSQ